MTSHMMYTVYICTCTSLVGKGLIFSTCKLMTVLLVTMSPRLIRTALISSHQPLMVISTS